jgi:hypothetical protein
MGCNTSPWRPLPGGATIVKPSSIARATGLVLGLTLALAVLLSGRVPEGSAQAPARVSLVVEPAVQLGVSPIGRDILSHARLTPGAASASGVVAVSNLTGTRLEARPRVRSTEPELDDVVQVALLAGGTRLYSGKLGGLRSEGAVKLRLAAKATRRIRIRLSVPDGGSRAIQGRSLELALDWRTRRAGR